MPTPRSTSTFCAVSSTAAAVTYKAGDYMFRPVGVPHQTSSRTGVETLLVYVKRRSGA